VVAANGDLLVADNYGTDGRGAIIRVNRITGAQSLVSSGGNFVDPSDLAIVPSPIRAYINTSDGVAVIDTRTQTVLQRISVPTAEGSSVVLDGRGSSDPDQPSGTLTYDWDLDGDGIFGETGAAAARGNEVAITPKFSATGLDGPRSLIVSLRVTDNGNLTSAATGTINIGNVAPSNVDLSLNAAAIDENGTVTVTGKFTDPGTLDTHTVVINWNAGGNVGGPGDGTTTISSAMLTDCADADPTSKCFTASHQYLDDNATGTPSDSYTISATVTDDDAESGTGSILITVNNVEPVIQPDR
jgi:hypothetical protein